MKLNKITSSLITNKTKCNQTLISAAFLALLTSTGVSAQDEQAAAPASDIEVIEVKGMLGSMKAAAMLKRTDGRIVDAIVAEDIGKLPDNNIAEALQRITGVSINTDFGVGDSVSIRGLPQNRVELNGRSTIGDSRDGISLQDFPSSFLKTVEVVKSPTADMIEGALGGTVSMKTVRPLELDKLTGAVSIDAEYSDKTENIAPIFSGSIGNNWDFDDAGTFGAIFMLSYQDRELRQDQYIARALASDIEIDGLTGNAPDGEFVVRDQHTIEQYVEGRERTAVNLSLQWAPKSGDGMVYLDLNTTKRSGEQNGTSIIGVGGSLVTDSNTTQDAGGQINNYTLTGEYAIPKTYSDFRETDSFSHALGGEWMLTDNITISGEIAVASSESTRPDSEFTLRPIERELNADGSQANHLYDGTFYQSGNKLPSIIHSDPGAYTDPENLALRTFKSELKNTDNDETAVRFDVVINEPLDVEWLTKVKTGFRATKRDYEYEQYKVEVKDIYKNALNADGSYATPYIDDFNALFPGSFVTNTYDNSFDQLGLSGQNDLLTSAIFTGLTNPAETYAQLQQLLAGTSLASTGSFEDNLEFQDSAYRDISENTTAFYISAYLDFEDITAIVGGRYITTDLESSVIRNGVLETGENDYSDFLPSVNVSYNYSDDTLVRFAAAKVMRRADFGELSPAFDVNNDSTKATQGAIDLEPYRATQYDLSVEHYFGTGNMLSFAVFYKDVESFLSTENTCVADSSTQSGQNVTEWYAVCQLDSAGVSNSEMVFSSSSEFSDAAGFAHVEALRNQGLTGIDTEKVTNGENGKVQGFEIGYQQHFSSLPGAFSGLGISANYTYADSEQPNGSPLLDISKNTYNLQGFWEYSDYAVRLAYNYRDSFLASESEKRVLNFSNNYRADRGQLDFSASWDINEQVTMVANATNLTGEPSIFESELGSAWKYTEADRRYTIGIRAKF
ncbi:TonB-dependent receptor [Pseudoalteromonas sp. MMG010]|uniref:TonB-dependent receptor n=1 Tax=Pseudoalteromonas sp. MMG010 TaxID=2822685 RepID=UPI001B39E904|nr:TonB-dependent receptor [Pseudoalteromonas sp. MMG010]MBQ4832051.1 TonB-dependent receptor [Pseudoalteromonas sp. MMG010]